MNFEQFHFIRPYWLLTILPLLVMLWLLLHRQLSSGNWTAVCDPELLPHILLGEDGQRRTWPIYVLGIAGLLSILALAGPTWERLPQPAFRDQSALVIVLDLSRSMDTTDIKPSRLIRARFKVADILKHRQEGQTALIVYAGDAFTVTPLTDDTETISSQLSVLNTSLMPNQGSRADIALEKAATLLQQAGLKSGNVLLMTDGVNETRTRNAVEKLKKQGYKLSILGVGTEEGAPIPQGSGGFLKDAQGAIVIPKLEEAPLRKFAYSGIYQRLQINDSDIKALLASFDSEILKNQKDKNDLQIDTWREQGPWLLLLVLPLAALAFRRGYLAVVLFLLLPIPPQSAQAFDWNSLWFTPDQQASEAFEKGDTQKAAELFNNPEWKAAAQYKAGQYEQALKSQAGLEGADNWYNKGNALARLGRYPEAIEAYKKALELAPEHDDAQYNKELVEKQLEQQDSQNQDSQNQDSQNQDSQNQDSQNQDSQNQDSQNQESQNSKSQDSQNHDSETQDAQETQASQNQEQEGEEGENSEEANSQASQENGESEESDAQQAEAAQQSDADETPDEMQQAHEQLLRKIHDDPGGLLRRKFKYQYQQRESRQLEQEQPW
jgi:Ca-activated chloride channel family protein